MLFKSYELVKFRIFDWHYNVIKHVPTYTMRWVFENMKEFILMHITF